MQFSLPCRVGVGQIDKLTSEEENNKQQVSPLILVKQDRLWLKQLIFLFCHLKKIYVYSKESKNWQVSPLIILKQDHLRLKRLILFKKLFFVFCLS